MNSQSFRRVLRTIWLGGELLLAALNYAALFALRRRGLSRAFWLQQHCRRICRVLNLDLRASGSLPMSGLLVSNHLSYLDVLVIGALTPAIFVAKHEVKRWPIFGGFARLAGTIFVDRQKRTRALRSSLEIESALDMGGLVVLFPEGTSSDGRTVLPFKSALLQAAAGQKHQLTAGFISYHVAEGDVSNEVCYWRDMTLLPHLLKLLGKRQIIATVAFSSLSQTAPNRKGLASQLHTEVLRLKESFCPEPNPA